MGDTHDQDTGRADDGRSSSIDEFEELLFFLLLTGEVKVTLEPTGQLRWHSRDTDKTIFDVMRPYLIQTGNV